MKKRYLIAVGCLIATAALAESLYWNQSPLSVYGKVAIAATTATKIASITNGRAAILIQNRDSASIYCGSDTSVTNLNGIEVVAAGSISLPVSFGVANGTVAIYCYSVAGQTSPADTRYWETQ